jgi:hypothetical protein
MRRALALVALVALAGGFAGCDAGPADTETWIAPASAHAGRTLRVAAVQFDARPEDPAHNRARMLELARAAAERDAELVLFHENALLDYGPRVRELAESVPDGPTCRALEALARELALWIGAGLAERAGEQVHVTHAFFGPDGYAGRYRKTWLFRSPVDPYRDDACRDASARHEHERPRVDARGNRQGALRKTCPEVAPQPESPRQGCEGERHGNQEEPAPRASPAQRSGSPSPRSSILRARSCSRASHSRRTRGPSALCSSDCVAAGSELPKSSSSCAASWPLIHAARLSPRPWACSATTSPMRSTAPPAGRACSSSAAR